MQVVNAFCGLFCCGHCHKAIATGSRTPSICHNLSPHHLKGKQRNVSDMKPPNIHHSKLLSSDPPQVLAPSWNEDPWGNPVTRCLKRGRWLGRIMLLSWRYYSPRATSISGYSFREPGWQHGEERKVKWRQSSGQSGKGENEKRYGPDQRWLGRQPVHQKNCRFKPRQGIYLGCGFGPWPRHILEATDWCFSLTLMFLSLSLKSINVPSVDN